MNLFIIKKVTVIYRANSFFLLLQLVFFSQAQAQEISSFCFEHSVSLQAAHQSLGILVLPKDIVAQRIEDNCLDIITSPDRGKLFEKYLSKRYDLKKDPGGDVGNGPSECRLDLKTTKKLKVESSDLKLGEKNALNDNVAIRNSVSIMEMLLGAGLPGEFEAGDDKLKISCQLIGAASASLNFSYTEKSKSSVSTQVVVKRGEWLNVASVIKDLSDKTKTIGVPQIEINQSTGKIETVYELQFK